MGSKKWWTLSNSLMLRTASKADKIPPLLAEDGLWAKSGLEKTDLFAKTLNDKTIGPEIKINEYCDITTLVKLEFSNEVFQPSSNFLL